jgi:dephospho-CoA kinase
MIKVGITGGIGSGKSLICQVFSHLKVPVYYADISAAVLTATDPEIRRELVAILGEEIFFNQALNKNLMSTRIFNDKSLLFKVNEIIHPKVAADFKEWCAHRINFPYVIEESAILFESNTFMAFDKIVTVTAPEDIRIHRIISRKNMTFEKVQAIINSQMPEKEKIIRSNHVIVNNGTELVIPQVLALHKLFMAKL